MWYAEGSHEVWYSVDALNTSMKMIHSCIEMIYSQLQHEVQKSVKNMIE